MRARFLPLLLLAPLAPLVAAIALHRSGAALGQPALPLDVEAKGLAAPLPVELRATYRARRCLPYLTCRADWSGGPSLPIEIEQRRAAVLQPGPARELAAVPRTLLSLAGFELVAISVRLGRGAGEGRVDLLLGAGAGALPSTGAGEAGAQDPCTLAVPREGPELRVPEACARVTLGFAPP